MTEHIDIAARDAQEWGAKRGTHVAVAMAIREIATAERPAQEIWEAPTIDEFEQVGQLVVHYVEDGMFRPTIHGNYNWGAITIRTAHRAIPSTARSLMRQSAILDFVSEATP